LEETVAAVRNRSGGWTKPQFGLWTSTYHPERGSDWVQWCLAEEFSIPPNGEWRGVILRPRRGARVYHVRTHEDLRRLVECYPHNADTYRLYPNWRAISRDYDAVHLTEKGQWATRLSYPHDLYGWDCESTVWFRWCFTRQEPIVAKFSRCQE
jgi:hypothetical protein